MITDAEFERIVLFIKKEIGVDLSSKRVLVDTRLENFISKSDFANASEYLNVAMSASGHKEAEDLINILTTNHTFFWREEKHFEYLAQKVLPEIKKSCERLHDIRIWCAASSTGEEPYTLAMVLSDFFGMEHHMWDTTVLATDVSTKVLKVATQGVYAAESINNLPVNWQRRFFKHNGDTVAVTDELKKQVLFRRLNLIEPFPFRKQLHIIFCRNVLIYFDEQTKKSIVDRMVDNLVEGGYLFIGTTESVSKLNSKLVYVAPSVYKKVTH